MNFFLIWHRFAVKYFVFINMILVFITLFFVSNLRSLSFETDWFGLFSKVDPVYKEYQQLPLAKTNYSTLYFKLIDFSEMNSDIMFTEIRSIKGVASIKKLPIREEASNNLWLEIQLKAGPDFAANKPIETTAAIKAYFKNSNIDFGVTGPIPIQEEFNAGLQNDFVRVSFIALVVILVLILYFFGFSLSVFLGLFYQGLGLVCSVYVFRHLFGPLNMLSATLPGVLLGLGIDYVIHCLSAVQSLSKSTGDTFLGEAVYRQVFVPIFWGAATTALAFLSFSLSGLKGLASAGIFGSLGIVFMFLFVIFFLPPAVSRFQSRLNYRKSIAVAALPFMKNKRRVSLFLLIPVCIALTSFITRVRFEDRVENLYDKQMASLEIQAELADKLKIYPSKLFIIFESANMENDLNKLRQNKEEFVPDFENFKMYRLDKPNHFKVILPIFPRKNPFDLKNFKRLKEELMNTLRINDILDLAINGDAVLYHHLNRLLMRGMSFAAGAVFLTLGAVLFLIFRNKRYVFASLAVLALAIFSTLGGFGIFSISLSVYTIILIPLFLGIGIDDCLHIAYLRRNGGKLETGSYVLKAITLTTFTTLLGYGSLIAADNSGFNSMGKAALLGLSLVFFCSVYLLPVLLAEEKIA